MKDGFLQTIFLSVNILCMQNEKDWQFNMMLISTKKTLPKVTGHTLYYSLDVNKNRWYNIKYTHGRIRGSIFVRLNAALTQAIDITIINQ